MAQNSAKNISLLYVEDDLAIASIMSRYLKHLVSEVYMAKDGKEGLELFMRHRPSLIITDVMMPRMNGLEMSRAIREMDEEARIIITSAYDDGEYFMEAINIGVDDFVIKPVERNKITEVLKKHIKEIGLRERIKEADDMRALILESTKDGVFGLDKEGRHTFVNTAAAKMLGYSKEELIGKKSHPLWHNTTIEGERLKEEECPIYKTLQQGGSRRAEKDFFQKKDGSFIPVGYSANPLKKEGETIGAVVTFWDLSERQKLKEEAALLEMAIKESTNSILILDDGLKVRFANRKFMEFFGYEWEELREREFDTLNIHTEAENYPKIKEALIHRLTFNTETLLSSKDATKAWIELSIYPIHSEENGADYTVLVAENITVKKMYEKKLSELNRSLEKRVEEEVEKNREKDRYLFEKKKAIIMGELIKDLAHHWRQPLAAIGIIIHNIKDAYDYDELTKEELDNYVKKATEQLQEVSKTIDSFRSFFKSSDQSREFTLTDLAEDALYIMKPQLRAKGIKAFIKKEGEVTPLHEGYADLKQVMLNLLKNSFDSVCERLESEKEAQGFIKIRIKGAKEMEIEDNGIGFDEAVGKKIFNPYFSTKTDEQGKGLGLYMAKVIIEKNMGGEIEASALSQGASFKIKLP